MIQIESPEQFNERIAEGKTTVACFSAPWCGGCKMVAPKVEKLSEELADIVSCYAVSRWARAILAGDG